jgi:uncharacterized membrane protein (DUF2068 family)
MPELKKVPMEQARTFKPSTFAWIAVVAVSALVIGGFALSRWKADEPSSQTNAASKQKDVASKQEEVGALVERISRHLPVNVKETPLVAIVTDVNVAKEQSPVFYKKAQNGDRLIVWSDKAVLYSPERDEIESVLVFQTAPPPSAAALASEHATVEIRNGSGVTGITAQLADTLRSQGLNVSKVTTTRVKQVYPITLVTNAGTRVLPASAQILAEYGSAVASSTVPGEAPVSADFLIILGKNDIVKYQK